jgi:hypothetical protein
MRRRDAGGREQWIIRTLQTAFVQKGYMKLDPGELDSIYRRVCALGQMSEEDHRRGFGSCYNYCRQCDKVDPGGQRRHSS